MASSRMSGSSLILMEHVRSHSESEFCFVVDSHFVQQPQHRVRVIDPGDDGAVSTTTFQAVNVSSGAISLAVDRRQSVDSQHGL